MMILSFLLFFLMFYVLDDIMVETFEWEGVYFLIHFLHNLMISFWTFPNVVRVLTSNEKDCDIVPFVIPMVYGLHAYHIVAYMEYMRLDDWIHHIVSMGIAVPLTIFYFTNLNILGMCFFFTTGIPGGLNYFNLFLLKNWPGYDKRVQQKINVFLQSWVRCPGIIMTCGFILQNIFSNPQQSTFKIWMGLLITSILFWNGVYFQNLVLFHSVKTT